MINFLNLTVIMNIRVVINDERVLLQDDQHKESEAGNDLLQADAGGDLPKDPNPDAGGDFPKDPNPDVVPNAEANVEISSPNDDLPQNVLLIFFFSYLLCVWIFSNLGDGSCLSVFNGSCILVFATH